jgi:hypothetical protein
MLRLKEQLFPRQSPRRSLRPYGVSAQSGLTVAANAGAHAVKFHP